MPLLDTLERRLGRYAVHHMSVAIIVGWILCYLLLTMNPEILDLMFLIPSRVLQGEVWRLFTFLLVPPVLNPIFFIFAVLIFYLFGSSLEASWGAFRYNCFLLASWLLTVVAGFVAMRLGGDLGGGLAALTPSLYLSKAVFLGFAWLFPEYVIHLFLVLPVKVKYLAMVGWGLLAYAVIAGGTYDRAYALACAVTVLLFTGPAMVRRLRSKGRRIAAASQERREASEPFHTCHVCGTTDIEDPERQFRVDSDRAGAPDICLPCLDERRAAGGDD